MPLTSFLITSWLLLCKNTLEYEDIGILCSRSGKHQAHYANFDLAYSEQGVFTSWLTDDAVAYPLDSVPNTATSGEARCESQGGELFTAVTQESWNDFGFPVALNINPNAYLYHVNQLTALQVKFYWTQTWHNQNTTFKDDLASFLSIISGRVNRYVREKRCI